eukprot:gnl/TRDRNA2_/TRDRNA2_186801_c0_seq1.p1 gnl/TRDRNA2_/TRDRNA2_186801_c0~~gnl/TRDRNA2_/TRDRNA2_186801_c0_seq1.p1  ORF type:complete len:594 (+),score=158.00 gnl/TRDRNA2_/TRDRNA2_186801_c0_seq1:47-1783(+)
MSLKQARRLLAACNPEEAMKIATDKLDETRTKGTPAQISEAISTIICIHMANDELKEAWKLAETELSNFKRSQNKAGVAAMLLVTAEVHVAKREADTALKLARQADEISKEIGDTALMAKVQSAMVNALIVKGAGEGALAAAGEALKLAKKADDKALQAMIWHATANAIVLREEQGGPAAHAEVLTAEGNAVELFRALEDDAMTSSCLICMGRTEKKMGRFDKARNACEDALQLSREAGSPKGIASALELMIEITFALNTRRDGLLVVKEEVAAFQQSSKNPKAEAQLLEPIIACLASHDEVPEALRIAQQARRLLKELPDRDSEAWMAYNCAELQHRLNQMDEAIKSASMAVKLFQETDNKSAEDHAKTLLTQLYVATGKANLAPHRPEAMAVFRELIIAAEGRDSDGLLKAEANLEKMGELYRGSLITQDDMDGMLKPLFNRDAGAASYIEGLLGWDLTPAKPKGNFFKQRHHLDFYYETNTIGGMGFGPQFRSVHPWRHGRLGDTCNSVCVTEQIRGEEWFEYTWFRHGYIDSMMQSLGMPYWLGPDEMEALKAHAAGGKEVKLPNVYTGEHSDS